jgi:hypothetical protein
MRAKGVAPSGNNKDQMYAAFKWIVVTFIGIAAGLSMAWLMNWLSASCLLSAVGDTRPINCVEFWLNRYQTLIAAIVALIAAIATIIAVRYQTLSAERLARRTEHDAEQALRIIIRSRASIFAEVWRGIDWALESDYDEATKIARGFPISGLLFDSTEDRAEFRQMQALTKLISPSTQIKISRLLARWEEMLEHLDDYPNEHEAGGKSVEWIGTLRRKFTMISRALDHYDPVLGDVFAGLNHPFMKPDESAKRTAAIRESVKKSFVGAEKINVNR